MHPLQMFQFCPRCGSLQFEEHSFKSKHCLGCGFVYYFNTSASTAAFITDEDGRLLVARRAKEPARGTLDLPGGFVDLFETAEEAMQREIKEETGLEVANFQYLFSLPNIYEYSGLEVHTLDLFFKATVSGSVTLSPADDVSELFFLDPKTIRSSDFGLASIRRAIERWVG